MEMFILSGEWRVASGEWRVASGELSGEWKKGEGNHKGLPVRDIFYGS